MSRIGTRRLAARTFVLSACLWLGGCGGSADGLDVYRVTNNQAGHDFVRAEQFLKPIGAVITIPFLDFAPGVPALLRTQAQIVQEIFNSLEEITENTVNDPDTARVDGFKKMQFQGADAAGPFRPEELHAASRRSPNWNWLWTSRWGLSSRPAPRDFGDQRTKTLATT